MSQNEQEKVKGRVSELSDPRDLAPYLSGEGKRFVLFTMTTCPYCRMFEERFLEFARARCQDFDFLRVVLDDPDNPLWNEYQIHVVPQIIVFAGGRIVERLDSIPFVGITKKNWAGFCARLG